MILAVKLVKFFNNFYRPNLWFEGMQNITEGSGYGLERFLIYSGKPENSRISQEFKGFFKEKSAKNVVCQSKSRIGFEKIVTLKFSSWEC